MLALFTVPFTPATAALAALEPEDIDSPDQVGEDVGAIAPQIPATFQATRVGDSGNYCKRTKISGDPPPDIRWLDLDQSRLRNASLCQISNFGSHPDSRSI
jgi:hypothetical protein